MIPRKSLYLIGILSAAVVLCGWYRSDDYLRRHFRRHRTELEQLIRLIKENSGGTRLGPGELKDTALAVRRQAEYRELRMSAGIERVVLEFPESDVGLQRVRFVVSHCSCGYTWSANPLAKEYESSFGVDTYTRLSAEWYISRYED